MTRVYPGRGGVIDPFTLEGRYVRLEPLTPGHVPALVAAASVDRGHYRLAFVPEGEVAMRAWVEVALGEQRAGRAVPFATVERATGRVLGSTRFGNIDRWTWPPGSPMQQPEGTPDVVEIGWTWLTAAAQRSGVNTDAKLAMLTHAFEVWRVLRVSLMTDSRNARSRGAIERLGARLDGVLRAARVANDGVVRDTAAYSILAAEWPGVKAGLAARLR